MSKVRNFAEITPNLPFSEFNFNELYRETFEKSELGRMKKILPLHEMAESFGLVNKSMTPKRGRKSYFTPEGKVALMFLKMNVDARGLFTELVHTLNAGLVSINISKPGVTKGQHWHNTKFEQFIVVAGHGLIQQRNLNDPDGKVLEWEVTGDRIQAVHMLPGYTHSIIYL